MEQRTFRRIGPGGGVGDGSARSARRAPLRASGLVAAWTGIGICVIGTHDPRRAADAWRELMARRHAGDGAWHDDGLDAVAWWHAQHRWARMVGRGWRLVRDRGDDAEPAMVLVGVYRD